MSDYLSDLQGDELRAALAIWVVMLYSLMGANLFALCTDLDGLWLKMGVSTLYCLGLV